MAALPLKRSADPGGTPPVTVKRPIASAGFAAATPVGDPPLPIDHGDTVVGIIKLLRLACCFRAARFLKQSVSLQLHRCRRRLSIWNWSLRLRQRVG